MPPRLENLTEYSPAASAKRHRRLCDRRIISPLRNSWQRCSVTTLVIAGVALATREITTSVVTTGHAISIGKAVAALDRCLAPSSAPPIASANNHRSSSMMSCGARKTERSTVTCCTPGTVRLGTAAGYRLPTLMTREGCYCFAWNWIDPALRFTSRGPTLPRCYAPSPRTASPWRSLRLTKYVRCRVGDLPFWDTTDEADKTSWDKVPRAHSRDLRKRQNRYRGGLWRLCAVAAATATAAATEASSSGDKGSNDPGSSDMDSRGATDSTGVPAKNPSISDRQRPRQRGVRKEVDKSASVASRSRERRGGGGDPPAAESSPVLVTGERKEIRIAESDSDDGDAGWGSGGSRRRPTGARGSDVCRKRGRKYLTHAQEIELGTKVQRYQELLHTKKRLTAILGRDPTLKEQASSAGLATGEYRTLLAEGHAARQRIIVSNIALVASIAGKYSDKSSSDESGCTQALIQEGTFGLIRAAEMYDPTKGFRFSTYATWWIHSKIRLAVQKQGQLIHLPTWLVNCHNAMSKSSRDLRDKLGREPTPEEIAEQLVIDTDSKVYMAPERISKVQAWASLQRKQISLDTTTKKPSENRGIEIHSDIVPSGEPSAEEFSDSEMLRSFLERCVLQDLSEVQRKILRMRAGLNGSKRVSRREISEALKIPLHAVVGEERRAYSKLEELRHHRD